MTEVGAQANPVFDRLFNTALADVLAGMHQRDEPPVDGGRWPVTVVARPPKSIRQDLERLMREGLQWAGPGHFLTGRADSVHLTIRALEPYRESAAATDPIVEKWGSSMQRACAATAPLRFSLTGVTLSTSGILAQIEPYDDAPWQLMDRLRTELGELAWYEDQWQRRDIWYSTLIHFATDIANAPRLVDWVRDHRVISPVEFTVDEVELVRYRYCPADFPHPDRLMRPERWFAVRLGAAPDVFR